MSIRYWCDVKPFTIENPIINSPFLIPTHCHTFDNDGFPVGIGDGRRPSSHRTASTAIAQPRKTQKPLVSDLPEEERENETVNRIRAKVDVWRDRGYPLLTNPLTRELLEYWRTPERERRLFFCQIVALETIVCVAEVAKGNGDEVLKVYSARW